MRIILSFEAIMTNMSNMSFKYDETCEKIIKAVSTETELNVPNNLKWPCSICNKNVTTIMKAVRCDNCKKWCHIKCDGTSAEEYESMVINENHDVEWHCLYCTIKQNHENIAFTLINDDEIYDINIFILLHKLRLFKFECNQRENSFNFNNF